MLASEWERAVLFAHHFAPTTAAEQFALSAIDVTAGAAPRAIGSTEFVCGESGWLPGAAHIYRTL